MNNVTTLNKLNQKETNIMNITNETNQSNAEDTTNRIMSKELYMKLVAEFKESTKNKEFKPYFGKDYCGNKIKMKGKFSFVTYIFYAILRGKDPAKTTHDVLSETYSDALYYLASSYNQIHKIMPSLTEELFKLIVSNFKNGVK
jgi:hypothetical protein